MFPWIASIVEAILKQFLGANRQAKMDKDLTTVGRMEVEHELHKHFLEGIEDVDKINEKVFNDLDDLRSSL